MNRQKRGKRTVNIPRPPALKKPGKPSCPICNSENCSRVHPEVRQLLRCRNCGVAFNIDYRPVGYDKRYFVDDYRMQYGKTYEEDGANITALANRRLDDIHTILPSERRYKDLRLMDIGSALGFFLKAAKDRGIGEVEGLEISEFAAGQCRKRFRIKVQNRSFEDARFSGTYDIITAWYFIEHCADPLKAIRAIYDLLNPGGIFAMATPSIFGPQYMFDRRSWAEQHPADHRVDFSPSSIREILKEAGFTQVKISVAGVHPERILSEKSWLYKPFSAVYSRLSRMMCFSDTMEVYAVK